MQLPTHLLIGVLIQKGFMKIRPLPLKYFLIAFIAVLSHGILDAIAKLTYHPPNALFNDWFWISYHLMLVLLIFFIFFKFWRNYKFGMIFSAFPDFDWIVLYFSKLFSLKIPFWEKPILHEFLFNSINSFTLFNFASWIPDLSHQRKGIIFELALLALIIIIICSFRKGKEKNEQGNDSSSNVIEIESNLSKNQDDIYDIRVKLEAYKILLERHINEDRVLAERTSTFLWASSILFLAFITIIAQQRNFLFLSVIICIFGILLCFIIFGSNLGGWMALSRWIKGEQIIEREQREHKNSVFTYMHSVGILPSSQLDPAVKHKEKRDFYEKIKFLRSPPCAIPIIFFLLWIVSLMYLFFNPF